MSGNSIIQSRGNVGAASNWAMGYVTITCSPGLCTSSSEELVPIENYKSGNFLQNYKNNELL